jgi:predicted Ser/Thr protein kinase
MSRINLLDLLADSQFFETIDYYQPVEDGLVDIVKGILPDDWQYGRNTVWLGCHPPEERDKPLPQQGWKIHISSSVSNADDILRAVVPVLAKNDVSFKFSLDRRLLALMHSKGWARQGAGKFITVYPLDEEQFKFLIEELHQVTRQFEGLYILSDKRYKDSRVVFYRYGGIRPYTFLNVKGENVSVLLSPEGEKVLDVRTPFFRPPAWAKDPFEEAVAEGSADVLAEITLKDGRYLVRGVLNFSNSGGVYVAEDRETGAEVVIKEARPCVTATEDAVALLRKEHRILTKLEHTGMAPKPLDFFQDWEHFFLVQEYIAGTTLGGFAARNNITLHTHPTAESTEKFYGDFRTLFLQLARVIEAMHENNVVLTDLSPNNVIVQPETMQIRLIDFEGACEREVDQPIYMYTPGFAYADQMAGSASTFESDYFSFGAVMHHFLAPVNQIFLIHPRARYKFIDSVTADIGFPRSVYEIVSALIDREAAKRPAPAAVIEVLEREEPVRAPQFAAEGSAADASYRACVEGIREYTLSVADYARRDRLFPADAKVFSTNPLSVAHGACGVAQVLQKIGERVPDGVLDWILERNRNPQRYAPGLYVGLAGIAWAMLDLGLEREAREVLASTFDHPLLYDSADVYHGLAGWGMTNLKFFAETQDEMYLRKAEEAGNFLLNTSEGEEERGCYWKSDGEIPLGYGHGASGISLFLLYLYLAGGGEKFLATGIRALDFDLNNSTPNLEDGLSWKRALDPTNIMYPYWRYGSAGVGAAVVRYYRLLGGERYREVLEKIFIDTNRKYAVYPGFLLGLSGLGEFLLDLYQCTNESHHLDGAYRVASGLSLFKIEKERGIAFPGDTLRRISCDYGTGSAGIGHFLHRLTHGTEGNYLLDQLFAGDRSAARTAEDAAVPVI